MGPEQVPHSASHRSAPLRGARLLLRLLHAEDGGRLEEILREPEVARWWGGYDIDAKQVVEEIFTEPDTVSYAIEADGELVGLIQYDEENTPDYRHAGIDIFLATAWQGAGTGWRGGPRARAVPLR